jgi:predicted dienelactone hydrolase
MTRFRLSLVTIVLVLVASSWVTGAKPVSGEGYKRTPGPQAVATLDCDWQDGRRNRPVPARIYYPKDAAGPFPVIIFSHGLGGSREGYAYLGQHWASYGYVSVHIQHPGSDTAVWKDKPRPMESMKAAANVDNAIQRPLDVRFAIDQMEKLSREPGPLKGRLDLGHIGVAGHSFGANTTLLVIGQRLPGPEGDAKALRDPRIRAAIPMSSPAPQVKNRLDEAFASIAVPCLHMTGTLDFSPIGATMPKDRRIPFDHIKGVDQYLVTFKGGDHMVFSDTKRPLGENKKDAIFHDMIRMSSVAFWDAYLKDDPAARRWLADGGFETTLDGEGKLEKKLPVKTLTTTRPSTRPQ